jgi:serine/threonine protein phosphatase PrpC
MSDKEARRPAPKGDDVATMPSAPAVQVLGLQIVKLTDVGRLRPHNEDYLDSYIPSDPQALERKGAIFLVADGMGGHQAGEVASKGAVELVIEQYYADTTHDIGTSLVRAFRAANQQIYSQAQADASKAGMGTTLVAAVILGRKVYLANVGDSRAYLVNKKGITQITEDHSWVEEQVRAGLLTPEQAHRHPQRNLLTRALGTKAAVDVDLFEGELSEGDSLLLCTDGLTGRVENAEIAAIVQKHPPEEAARLLIAQANERGGNDNITALIVSDWHGMPTAAMPVPAVVQKKPASSLPLLPILMGVAGLLVLALAAYFILPPLLKGRATATPTVTSPALTATLSPATEAVPTTEVSPAPSETVTLEVTGTLPVATSTLALPTPTFTPTLEFTPTPTFTLTPTPTFTLTPTPTFTPTPTVTPTVTPTPTPTLTPSLTATVTQTSTIDLLLLTQRSKDWETISKELVD